MYYFLQLLVLILQEDNIYFQILHIIYIHSLSYLQIQEVLLSEVHKYLDIFLIEID